MKGSWGRCPRGQRTAEGTVDYDKNRSQVYPVEQLRLHPSHTLLRNAVIVRNKLLMHFLFFFLLLTGQEQATHEIQEGKP